MKPLFAATIWILLMLALFVFRDAISDVLFILYPLLKWTMWSAGFLITGYALASAPKSLKPAVIAIAICLVGFTLFHTNGFDWGRVTLFKLRRSEFESKLELALSGEIDHRNVLVDDGPPKLYAFRWYGGILDNWRGVVYDPTGRLDAINDAEGWDEIHDHELSGLFGGTFYHCQNVGDGWYICYFT